MKIYIYKLVDPVNHIVGYIGETTNPDQRLQGHLADMKPKQGTLLSLKIPVTEKRENWLRWLHLMKITPILVVIDEIDGNKREGRALENKHIVNFSKRGYRLCNDYQPTKENVCPYKRIWNDVWQKYEKLLPKQSKAEMLFPELNLLETKLQIQLNILRAIESKVRNLAKSKKQPFYNQTRKINKTTRTNAEIAIRTMFENHQHMRTIVTIPDKQGRKLAS